MRVGINLGLSFAPLCFFQPTFLHLFPTDAADFALFLCKYFVSILNIGRNLHLLKSQLFNFNGVLELEVGLMGGVPI
jgi:hypothetical protein